ncbi:type II toxin-antitoxin system RelE/ParE family toxin [Candidatus Woesearchaeota archaeon]|nr:type II toxin-antitoxin system RelE/ParE family toxin [Candidatus Woesearchaeota archaeon]
MYSVEYSQQARKFLKSCNRILIQRIFQKIDRIQNEPVIPDTKVIQGFSERLYRVRVGEYRILYEVDYSLKMIGIVKIDKRSRVYD